MFVDNPQLLFTLDQPPTDGNGRPRQVEGVVMLDKYLYVVYELFNKVEVFDCEDLCRKIKDIGFEGIKSPYDMVGCSMTSQLFIKDRYSDVIWRMDSKTEVSDVFVKTGYKDTRLSLVENRLLVTSRDSLLMFDIFSGESIKKIPLLKGIKRNNVQHAIESNRDSFFVSHGMSDNSTVSEIDSEGRVIRVFNNKQQLGCVQLALDSVGRLLVSDFMNSRVVLFDEHLKYDRILIDTKRLNNSRPWTLNYNKNNNRLTVGLNNGQVKIFEY